MEVDRIDETEDLIAEAAVAASSTEFVPSGSLLMVVRPGDSGSHLPGRGGDAHYRVVLTNPPFGREQG